MHVVILVDVVSPVFEHWRRPTLIMKRPLRFQRDGVASPCFRKSAMAHLYYDNLVVAADACHIHDDVVSTVWKISDGGPLV